MPPPTAAPSTSSGPAAVLGRTVPRLWTAPLRELTPEASYGYDVIAFARDVLDEPLDEWQAWLVVHMGELLPDGRPRFRTVLAIVSRQQGKSHLIRVLILFWLFVERQKIVLATSTDRSYAKAAWRATVDTAKSNPWLSAELPARATVEQLGEEELRTVHGSKYKFAATNRRAGRSLTINRLVIDEIREHVNYDAWSASTFAMNAVPTAQAVCVSNQGDITSVVLEHLRTPALTFIETGEGDPRLGLFEWSCPPGSSPTDLHALAYSCPSLGRGRTDADTLLGTATRAVAAGGEELTSFRTEVMCQKVPLLDPAIDHDRWHDSGTGEPLDLAEHRRQVALCFDISLDGTHASLVAAAVVDGRVHVEVVKAWSGHGCGTQIRGELPALVEKVRPRALGWFPMGPAAALAAELKDRGARGWPPPRVKVAELTPETTAVCMGLAEQVRAGELVHPRDPMLDAHVAAAQKLHRGDGWVFVRRGSSPIDGAYALAGAVHLARTLPPAPPPLLAL